MFVGGISGYDDLLPSGSESIFIVVMLVETMDDANNCCGCVYCCDVGRDGGRMVMFS